MNIAVIGAGITGCTVAATLLEAGHNVTIYEASDKPGGILGDYLSNEEYFFHGCQYINSGSQVDKLLCQVEGLELLEFDHCYGSYNDLFNQDTLHHNFAQIVFPHHRNDISITSPNSIKNLGDRIECYEKDISTPLINWIKNFGCPSQLHHANADILQTGRILYEQAIPAAIQKKQQCYVADQLLGVPKQNRIPQAPTTKAKLPRHGYTDMFRKLSHHLESKGATFRYHSPVKPFHSKNTKKPSIKVRGKNLSYEYLVWCANPTFLLNEYCTEALESPVTKCFTLMGNIENAPRESPIYYQIFSKKTPIFRIYFNNTERNCISIEGLRSNQSLEAITGDANYLMHKLGWQSKLLSTHITKSNRHILLTNNDALLIAQFNEKAKNLNIVPGGWEHYGRDHKIEAVINTAYQFGIL
jgi:hypothetical protein